MGMRVPVSYSTTPNFASASITEPITTFALLLAGDVSSSTITGFLAGQLVAFELTQDGTGNRVFTWPLIVKNFGIIQTGPNTVSTQWFEFDGTNFYPIGEMLWN